MIERLSKEEADAADNAIAAMPPDELRNATKSWSLFLKLPWRVQLRLEEHAPGMTKAIKDRSLGTPASGPRK